MKVKLADTVLHVVVERRHYCQLLKKGKPVTHCRHRAAVGEALLHRMRDGDDQTVGVASLTPGGLLQPGDDLT